jgi:hypothetical protein
MVEGIIQLDYRKNYMVMKSFDLEEDIKCPDWGKCSYRIIKEEFMEFCLRQDTILMILKSNQLFYPLIYLIIRVYFVY